MQLQVLQLEKRRLKPEARETLRLLAEAMQELGLGSLDQHDNLPEGGMQDALEAIFDYARNGESAKIEPKHRHCVPFNVQLTAEQDVLILDIKEEVWRVASDVLQILHRVRVNGFISEFGHECPAGFSLGEALDSIDFAKQALGCLETKVGKLYELMHGPLKAEAMQAPSPGA
jgi:hypothetical protein